MPQRDKYDDKGRFLGREGGEAGVDFGVGNQNNDYLGNAIAAQNQQYAQAEAADAAANEEYRKRMLASQQAVALSQPVAFRGFV